MTRHTVRRRHSSQRASRARLKPGSAPGILLANPDARASAIRVMGYTVDDLIEQTLVDPAELPALRQRWPVLWVNVDGLGDMDLLQRLGQEFGIHPLALEDVVDVHQRPKVERYSDHLFASLRKVFVEVHVLASIPRLL